MMNEKFEELWRTFNLLVNIAPQPKLDVVKYFRIVRTFKESVNAFEKEFEAELGGTEAEIESVKTRLNTIKKKISDGIERTEFLKKIEDTSTFSKLIIQMSYTDLFNQLQIEREVALYNKDHKRTIYKGLYRPDGHHDWIPCFLKIFPTFGETSTYLYEQYIYNYIQSKNEILKRFENDFFVKNLSMVKIDRDTYLKYFGALVSARTIRHDILYDMILKAPCENTFAHLTITENHGGYTIENTLSRNYDDGDYVTSILFDIVYGIYIMNDKMKIMHNDMHFDNVFIKAVPKYIKTYSVGKVTFTRELNYKIYIYDYDLSNMFEPASNNATLNMQPYGLTLDKSSKDIWTMLNSLLHLKIPDYNAINYFKNLLNIGNETGLYSDDPVFTDAQMDKYRYIRNITNVILNNSDVHKRKYRDIYSKSIIKTGFWNNNCTTNYEITKTCKMLYEPDLFPLPILIRMLANTEIYRCLNIQNIDPFYKKYIKYKLKYLNEKKIKLLNIFYAIFNEY